MAVTNIYSYIVLANMISLAIAVHDAYMQLMYIAMYAHDIMLNN